MRFEAKNLNMNDPISQSLKDGDAGDETVLESMLERQKDTGHGTVSTFEGASLMDEEPCARGGADANGIEFVDLSPDMIDPMVAHLISHKLASRCRTIPLERRGSALAVAMASPLDLAARDEIEVKTGYTVIPVAATPEAIRQAIQHHFDEANITKQVVASMRLKEDVVVEQARGRRQTPLSECADDPISKLVSSIIKGAITARASDIHIEPQAADVRVRYRIDGTLRDTIRVPASVH